MQLGSFALLVMTTLPMTSLGLSYKKSLSGDSFRSVKSAAIEMSISSYGKHAGRKIREDEKNIIRQHLGAWNLHEMVHQAKVLESITNVLEIYGRETLPNLMEKSAAPYREPLLNDMIGILTTKLHRPPTGHEIHVLGLLIERRLMETLHQVATDGLQGDRAAFDAYVTSQTIEKVTRDLPLKSGESPAQPSTASDRDGQP